MSTYQLFLRTGVRIYPDDARAATAKLLNGFQPGLLGALMHYTEGSSGKREPSRGFPPVHFAPLRDGFSLVGFGETGEMVLQDAAEPLARAWSEHLRRPVLLDSRIVPTGIEWRPYMMRYTIPRLVVQKKPRHLKPLSSEETGRPFVEALLRRSLQAQADYLGLVVPDKLELRFLSSTGSFAAALGHGGAALAGMRNATFEANVALKGLWSFGYIASKGYGLLNADYARGGRGVQHAVSQ